MQIQGNELSKARVRTGYVLTALATLFMVFDGVIHILKPAMVTQAFVELGYPMSVSVELGVLVLCCVALYAFPRTSVLGAILLTGYLGGAVSTHVRVGNPMFEQLFPVIFGIIIWAGIYLREARLGELVPVRR